MNACVEPTEVELKAWIPFANQDNVIRELYNDFPEFIVHINAQIQRHQIPLAFDWECELVDEIAAKFDEKPIGSFLRLWEFQKYMIGKYRSRSIVHLVPERLRMVGDFIGVEFLYRGTEDDKKWLPKDVKVVGNFYPRGANDLHHLKTLSAKDIEIAKHSTIIFSFVTEAFN